MSRDQTLQEKVSWLQRQANRIRISSLRMVHAANLGHPGGDLSSADILATLYLAVLRVDKTRPDAPDRDRFIMSKGHCSGALYSTLAAAGILQQSSLDTYMKPLSPLNGHPDRNKVPGVEANTGPLGHGLPIAVGCAMAGKIDSAAWRVFVLTGDGELQEGSNWEAAMAAAHYKLDNLTLIVDRNGIQQGDFTENTIRMEPLADKWRAFGWSVREVNGNDPAGLLACFESLPAETGKPTCVIAHTEKGYGVSFIRNRPEWHHHVPTAAELEAAIRELEARAE
ncbi:MAG: transketolase [Candidatus Acidiferrales bacterium]